MEAAVGEEEEGLAKHSSGANLCGLTFGGKGDRKVIWEIIMVEYECRGPAGYLPQICLTWKMVEKRDPVIQDEANERSAHSKRQ